MSCTCTYITASQTRCYHSRQQDIFCLSSSVHLKVTGGRGNNLHETVTAQGETFLVSMPTKFRKNLWIKRGNGWEHVD